MLLSVLSDLFTFGTSSAVRVTFPCMVMRLDDTTLLCTFFFSQVRSRYIYWESNKREAKVWLGDLYFIM